MPERQPDSSPAAITDALRERLFQSRTLIISGEINQQLASSVIAQLLALSTQSEDDITMFINSQGGHVESGDTIHDLVRFIRPRVKMVGTGWVASAGALIFIAAPLEDRFCLPNTRFLLHQPSSGMQGTASDVIIGAKEIIKLRGKVNELLARETGQSVERIVEDTQRDYWMSAAEAKEYGLISRIVESAAELD